MTYLTGSGVALNVYGSDMEQMQSAAKTLAAKLATVPGTENVSDGLEQAATALHLSVDRNAAMEKGLTVAQVYMAVASALTDTDSSLSLTLDGLDVSVSIQSPEESRMTREKLMDLEIDPSAMSAMSSMMSAASGSGSMSGMSGMSSGSGSMSGMSGMSSGSTSTVQAAEPVRLGDIAKLEETVSLNTIHRDQQRRYITVSADVADGCNVTKVTTAAQAAIAEVDLPQGITASFQGENEAIMDAIRQLLLMLLLGIVLVYLVMVAQFQSLRPGGLHQPAAAGGYGPPGGHHRGRRHPPAAHSYDVPDHDPGPGGHGLRQGCRHGPDAAGGPGVHRRSAVRHADDPAGGALHV